MSPANDGAPQNDVIFKFSTIVCLFPFTAPRGSRLALNRSLLAASFAFTGAVWLVGLGAIYDFLPRYKGNIFLQGLIFIYMSCYLSIYPCHLLIIYLQRKNLEKLFQRLKRLYSSLNRSIPYNIDFFSYIDISIVIIWSILLCFTRVPVLYGIYTWIAVGSLPVVCGQFSNLVDVVTDLLQAGISNLKITRQCSFRHKGVKAEKVMGFANRILSASVSLNNLFSYQMLLIMSMCFWGTCTHLYRIIIGYTYPSEKVNTFTLPHICNFLLCSYSVWRVNHSVTSAVSKSQEFNTLLYQLMIDDKTNEILNNKHRHQCRIPNLKDEIEGACRILEGIKFLREMACIKKEVLKSIISDKLRLHISMKREVVFTACGFFNLGYALVHSMIASATTYLVILLQFGQP